MAAILYSQYDPDPTLVVGEDCQWRYRGRLIQHPESLRLFKANLKPHKDGGWRTWWGKSSLKVKVEGPALVVKRLIPQGHDFLALLDTETEVTVPQSALRTMGDRLALCVNGVLAVLSSECASSLMDGLEESGQNSWSYRGCLILAAQAWNAPC